MRQTNSLLLIVLVAWTLLAACGSENPTPVDTPQPSNTATPTVVSRRPCDLQSVRVGVSTDSKPFVFKDSDGQVVGFDIDLMNAIAQNAGLSVAYLDVEEMADSDWGTVFQDVANAKFDVVISQASITPDRQQLVEFSAPYYRTGLAIVVQKGSDIQDTEDLADKLVGVVQSTTGEAWVLEQVAEAEIVSFPVVSQAFKDLDDGVIDAVVHDDSSARSFIAEYGNLQGLEGIMNQESYGIAVRQDCPQLLEAINGGLERAMASANYGQFCEDWAVEAGCMPPTTAAAEPGPSPSVMPTVTGPEPTTGSTPVQGPSPTPTSMPAPVCGIPSGTPEGAGLPYQIQAGDWLSAIAEREYGNPLDYRAIVHYTNQKCQAGEYNCVENPSIIRTGWTVYLPTPDEVDAYWQGIVNLPEVDFGVGGDIEVTGSSTVYLLTRHLAACFQAGGFDGRIHVESTGTGAGFEAFCVRGQADLVDASRPIGKDELETCRTNDREPIALQVGTDAITIVVSQQNGFARDLTLDELRQVLATASMWSEVRAEWPAEPIKRFYPTEASGTFDVLVNLLFGGEKGPLLEAANIIKQSEDDEELATVVQEGAYGVGFFGYAYYQRHQEALRTLPVEGIQPRPETVDEGTYPLIRPLFIYTTEDLVKGEPEVAAFINFYLRYAKHYIVDIGYFLPDEEALTRAIQVYSDMIE